MYGDITKIRTRLGWQPKIPIEEGVARLVANIEYWREAPLWNPDSIAVATKSWFTNLST